MIKKKIAIIGLGYVGLPLAVEFAKKYKVIGFDINQSRVRELKKNKDSTFEINKNILSSVRNNLIFTTKTNDIKKCNIYIISVPTPIDEFKKPNLNPLIEASKLVGKVIKKNDLIIYESTVYPGVTEDICVKELEKSSGLKFNKDFFCGYSPERINPGDKVNTLTNIMKVTSGSNLETANKVNDLYKSIITAGTFQAKSIKVAEAAKVIENTQRDLNIALINELSVILGRLNLDTLEVLEAAGTKWNFLPFRPGLVGGHCIGVDPYYLTYVAEQVNYNPQVILAGRRINDNMGLYVIKKVIQMMIKNNIKIKNCTIGLMGVTFKEDLNDIRNSKVIDMFNELKNWGAKVIVVDPLADKFKLKKTYGIQLGKINSKNKVDSLIIAVGHKQFKSLSAKELRSFCKGSNPVIADIKSIYKKTDLTSQGFSVFRL